MSYNSLKKNLIVPKGVSVEFSDGDYYIFGPKGKIKHSLHQHLSVDICSDHVCIFFNGKIEDVRKREISKIIALINTTCSLFKSYFHGVLNFFSCVLILQGVGYKAKYDDNTSVLNLSIGYSHPIEMSIPQNIFIEIPDATNIIIRGVSKHDVGQIAWNIREKRIPEVYKGNGIRYKNEIIKLKSPKKSK